MAHLVHVGNFIIWFSKHVINKKKTNRSSLFSPKALTTAYWKGECRGGSLAKLASLKSWFISQSFVSILPGTVIFRNIHPNDRGGRGRGFLGDWQGQVWTFTGSSQECVWSRGARRGGGPDQTEGCKRQKQESWARRSWMNDQRASLKTL